MNQCMKKPGRGKDCLALHKPSFPKQFQIFFFYLQKQLSRLDQKLKTAKLEADNAKRDLKNEIEGRKLVEKKMTATEKENKDLRGQVGSLRVRMGVVNANINVGKHETDELKKNNQENQVTIAR